jgi:sugar transferase (PEP-CTERM/EpsH1 system associated)
MRLLVLSSRPPWPPTRADQMTVDRMIRFLAGRGHEVDLACFTEAPDEERVLREGLGGVCRRIDALPLPRWRSYASTLASLPTPLPMQVAYYRSPEMRRLVETRVAEGAYDLVYVHLIRMTEYVRKLAVPKAVGLQISQALNLDRMYTHAKDPARKLFYWVEARKVRPYEAHVCADFDQVFLVGQRDVEELQKTAPVSNAMVCPHGQDIPPLERVRGTPREPGSIVVSGVMATYTNVDAVSWFAKEIFPLVERQLPEASFWIVGRSPQRAVQELARPPRVVVTGEVPDVYDWLCRAQVGVAPLRIGAGMQNKLVQAMAAELPVVASTIANEGIGATPESQLLLRDEPAAFADAVVALLRDAAARERLGRAARAFVEAHWTWEAHFEEMEKALLRIARR